MRKVAAISFADDDLYYLVRNCPSLRSLSLCPPLRSLSLQSHSNALSHVGIRTLEDLQKSLEELTFGRESGYGMTEAYYYQTAAALVDVLSRCSRLQKVSLTGDALRSVNLEQLLPYGHLFHELEFRCEGQPAEFEQAVSKLLVTCSNPRKLCCKESDDEQDSLFLSSSMLRGIAGMDTLKELTLEGCVDLTDAAGITVLATMKLVKLCIYERHLDDEYDDDDDDDDGDDDEWAVAFLQSFVGSNISQTLETFKLSASGKNTVVDDVQVAMALASCRNLKALVVCCGNEACVFGRNGLDGLQAMAAGCPLLADAFLYVTVPGLHYLGTHFTSLKKCLVLNGHTTETSAPEGFPSIEELQTLYPAVKWRYT
jgi:hypothetical protein